MLIFQENYFNDLSAYYPPDSQCLLINPFLQSFNCLQILKKMLEMSLIDILIQVTLPAFLSSFFHVQCAVEPEMDAPGLCFPGNSLFKNKRIREKKSQSTRES